MEYGACVGRVARVIKSGSLSPFNLTHISKHGAIIPTPNYHTEYECKCLHPACIALLQAVPL